MNDIDRMLNELDDMLADAHAREYEANEAQRKAEELKKQALEDEQSAQYEAAAIKEAIRKAEEAKDAYNIVGGTNDTYEDNSNKSKRGFVPGFISGTLIAVLAAGGIYALSRESKVGTVEVVRTNANTDTNTTDNSLDLIVTPSPLNEDATVFDADVAINNVEKNNQALDNSTNDVTSSNDTQEAEKYEELTTEKFDSLVADVTSKYNSLGLKLSEENIRKYVMILNIDQLRQDNNELISEIIGSQDYNEVFADADSVIDAILTYNLLYFNQHHDTNGFISASEGIFNKDQKAKVLEIERRVYEIGAYYQDEEKYNKLTYDFLRDMTNPTEEISELEDGVSYATEWIYMYMIRSTFGTDRYIKLDETNADLVKYFVSFAGDGEEYETNALVNGNYRNILALLRECSNTKTLTK